MDAHDEHLLVVGTVEHRDLARGGQMLLITPEVVVRELLGRWLLEALHRHAGGIDAAQDVADRAVLTTGVEGLDDDEHPVALLGSEPPLIVADVLDCGLEKLLALLLAVDLDGVSGIEVVSQANRRPGPQTQRLSHPEYPLLPRVAHPLTFARSARPNRRAPDKCPRTRAVPPSGVSRK